MQRRHTLVIPPVAAINVQILDIGATRDGLRYTRDDLATEIITESMDR
jgi:hypothetical protein